MGFVDLKGGVMSVNLVFGPGDEDEDKDENFGEEE